MRLTTVNMCALCVVFVAAKLLWIHYSSGGGNHGRLRGQLLPGRSNTEKIMTCSSPVLSLVLSFFFPRCCWIPLPVRPPHPLRTTGGAQRCYANGAVSQKSNGAINYIYISFATSPLLLLPSFFYSLQHSPPTPCMVCRA